MQSHFNPVCIFPPLLFKISISSTPRFPIQPHQRTLFSRRISIITLRHMSTPSSSSGRWRGKSTRENRVWSGSAKMSEGWRVGDKISICNNKVRVACIPFNRLTGEQNAECRHTSTLVFPGTGTGALSSLKIQVSISRTSCRTMAGVPS